MNEIEELEMKLVEYNYDVQDKRAIKRLKIVKDFKNILVHFCQIPVK